MPKKIPIIESRISPLSAVGRRPPQVQPLPTAGVEAQLAAKTIGAITQIVGKVEGAISHIEASNLNAQLTDFQAKMDIKFKEALLGATPNVEGGEIRTPQGDTWDERFVQEFNEELDRMEGGGFLTAGAQDFFNKKRNDFKARFEIKLAGARQVIAGQKAVLSDNKTVTSLSVSAYNDFDNVDTFILDYKEAIDNLVNSGLLSKGEGSQWFDRRSREIGLSAVQGQIDANVFEAKKIFDSGDWDKFFKTGGEKSAVKTRIDNKITTLENRQNRINLLKETAPWKFAEAIGARPSALDFTDQDKLLDSLIARKDWHSSFIREHTITGKMPIVSPRDVATFKDRFDGLNADKQAATLELMDINLRAVAGPFQPGKEPPPVKIVQKELESLKVELGKALFISDPSLAVAHMNAGELDTVNTTLLLDGRRIRIASTSEKGKFAAFKLPPIGATFEKLMGSDLFRDQPSLRAAFKQAVYDHYIGWATKFGKLKPDSIVESDFEDSIEVILPTFRFNNVTVPAFRSANPLNQNEYIVKSQFEDVFGILTDDFLEKELGSKPFNIKGQAIKIQEGRGRIELSPLQEGLFWMKLEDGLVFDKNGRRYLLDMKKLEGTIRPIGRVEIPPLKFL